MTDELSETGHVPVDELRELVKSFRIKGKWANENENYNYAFGREDSADELEEVIDRYE